MSLPLIRADDEILIEHGLKLLRAALVRKRRPIPPRLDELLAAAADVGGQSRPLADAHVAAVLADADTRPPMPLFLNTRDYADIVGCSDRAVRRRCAAGQIEGAHRQGKSWLIPRFRIGEPHD